MDRKKTSCVILATSDIHGYIHPVDYRTGEEKPSCLAKLAARIKEERGKTQNLLLIDNGDMLQGSPIAAYAAANPAEVHPCIAVMNGLDMMLRFREIMSLILAGTSLGLRQIHPSSRGCQPIL